MADTYPLPIMITFGSVDMPGRQQLPAIIVADNDQGQVRVCFGEPEDPSIMWIALAAKDQTSEAFFWERAPWTEAHEALVLTDAEE